MGCHFPFQGILLMKGLNARLLHRLHWQANSLPLRHLVSTHILVKETENKKYIDRSYVSMSGSDNAN